MADYTDLPNTAVGVGGIPSGTTVTALRDNPIAIAEGAAGAPAIVGVPYDYQEFTASGTWTKPASALTGDKVIVQVIGGGGAGGRNNSLNNSTVFFARGGGGAGGVFHEYQDIDDLSATETVTVGAGATGRSSSGTGATGGNSEFRSATTDGCVRASGGPGGTVGSQATTSPPSPISGGGSSFRHLGAFYTYNGENSGGGSGMIERGGGSGGYAIRRRDTPFSEAGTGSPAQYEGNGGNGQVLGVAPSGSPYGGGGGASLDGTSGDGGDGVVRVWCVRKRT